MSNFSTLGIAKLRNASLRQASVCSAQRGNAAPRFARLRTALRCALQCYAASRPAWLRNVHRVVPHRDAKRRYATPGQATHRFAQRMATSRAASLPYASHGFAPYNAKRRSASRSFASLRTAPRGSA